MGDDLTESSSPAGPGNPPSDHRGNRRLVTNALLNLARGAASALLPIALPAVLIRQLRPPGAFSAWVLILTVAAYVALLDLGLQVAVGRFVAREHQREATASRNAYYRGAVLMLVACAVLGILAVSLVSWRLEQFSPNLPIALLPKARWAMFIVGIAASLGLPGSAAAGFFIGLERNVVPTVILGAGKTLQWIATSLTAWATHDLLLTAAAFAMSYLVTQLLQLASVRILVPDSSSRVTRLAQAPFKELLNYCATVSLWTVGGLLVTGLDIILVNRFEFGLVAAYASAANLIAVFIGIMSSVFNVLGARSSALDAAGNSERLGVLLLTASRWCGVLTLVAGIAAWTCGPWGLTRWLGPVVGLQALPILRILVIANGLRMPLVPYSVILLGTGQQRVALWAPIVEGVANLIASIALGRIYGAMGVAYGTLIGAAFGVLWQILVNIPRTTVIPCTRLAFVREGYGRGMIAFAPLLVFLVPSVRSDVGLRIGFIGPAVLLVLAILWLVTLQKNERARVSALLPRRRQT